MYLHICQVGVGSLISFPKGFQERDLEFLDQCREECFLSAVSHAVREHTAA